MRDFPLALSISMQKGVKNKALAVICDLMDIVSVDHGEPESLYARLADLIDPMCHIVLGDETNHAPHCDRCGGTSYDLASGYCPSCGRRVMK